VKTNHRNTVLKLGDLIPAGHTACGTNNEESFVANRYAFSLVPTLLGIFLLAVSAQAICTNAISPTFQSFLSTVGNGSVSVLTPAGCAWTATNNDAFITITSATSGTGNGTVDYSIAANTNPSARGGTMTIAGQTFTVLQAAAPCTVVLGATGASFGSAGGASNVNATASATNCVFFSNSNDNWLLITGGSSLVGTGTVRYTVAPNTNTSLRSGTLNIGSQVYTVTQASAGMSVLPFGVAPTNGVTPLPVTFTDTSVGTITNRTWTFGDGSSLSTASAIVTHTYGVVPSGDVNKDGKVSGADSLLINQVLVGLRSSNSVVFQASYTVRLVDSGPSSVTTNDCVNCVTLNVYPNGDVNMDGAVTGADSLRINQVLVGLRTYVVTRIVPNVRSNTVPTVVTIYGIGFPTNTVGGVTIGAPVNLSLTNIVVVSPYQINALVPVGGGIGTGTVSVTATPSIGVISSARFINQ